MISGSQQYKALNFAKLRCEKELCYHTLVNCINAFQSWSLGSSVLLFFVLPGSYISSVSVSP